MQIKDAVVRTARTVAAVIVGVTLVLAPVVNALPPDLEVAGVNIHKATSFAFASLVALAAGLVTLATNLAEDNTRFQLPK